jgi:hypothetical protein
MRTTVRLDERLLRQAKAVAAEERRTLTAVIDDALRQFLARRSAPRSKRERVELIILPGQGGLQPGVDLDDTAALLDLMDAGKPVDKLR